MMQNILAGPTLASELIALGETAVRVFVPLSGSAEHEHVPPGEPMVREIGALGETAVRELGTLGEAVVRELGVLGGTVARELIPPKKPVVRELRTLGRIVVREFVRPEKPAVREFVRPEKPAVPEFVRPEKPAVPERPDHAWNPANHMVENRASSIPVGRTMNHPELRGRSSYIVAQVRQLAEQKRRSGRSSGSKFLVESANRIMAAPLTDSDVLSTKQGLHELVEEGLIIEKEYEALLPAVDTAVRRHR